MASTLPLKVAALIPEPLFLETPFGNYPDDVAASNAAQSSGAGDVDWSSVTFKHVEVNYRHLEVPETESRPLDLDVQEYDLTSIGFAQHYWPVRGFWASGGVPGPCAYVYPVAFPAHSLFCQLRFRGVGELDVNMTQGSGVEDTRVVSMKILPAVVPHIPYIVQLRTRNHGGSV